MATDTDFVLTADSRASNSARWSFAPHYRDNECKIRTFNNNIAFAAAGIVANRRGWQSWDIRQIAAQVITSSQSIKNAADLDRVAYEWGVQVKAVMDRDTSLAPFWNVSPFIQSIFATVIGRKVHATEVNLTIGEEPETHPFAHTPHSNVIHIYGTRHDFILQYVMKRGADAPSAPSQPITETKADLVRQTYAVTQFAVEESGNTGNVGGPIDQIALGANGIEWLHQKPECKQ